MENKILKYYKGTVKSFDEAKKTALVTVSTKEVDRDGDIVLPEAFKKSLKGYKKHAVLLSSHRQDTLTRQIGEAKNIKITDDGVDCEFEWYVGKGNPEADWGFFLITKDIASFSIGFIGKAYDVIESKDDNGVKYMSGRKFTEIEWMETSQVLVPSNRGALQANRAAGELCEVALKSVSDEEFKVWSEKAIKPEEEAAMLVVAVPPADPETKETPNTEEKAAETPEAEETKKHYTDDLFGKGEEIPTPVPAKAQSDKEINEKRKQALKDALSETVGHGG